MWYEADGMKPSKNAVVRQAELDQDAGFIHRQRSAFFWGENQRRESVRLAIRAGGMFRNVFEE